MCISNNNLYEGEPVWIEKLDGSKDRTDQRKDRSRAMAAFDMKYFPLDTHRICATVVHRQTMQLFIEFTAWSESALSGRKDL